MLQDCTLNWTEQCKFQKHKKFDYLIGGICMLQIIRFFNEELRATEKMVYAV